MINILLKAIIGLLILADITIVILVIKIVVDEWYKQ